MAQPRLLLLGLLLVFCLLLQDFSSGEVQVLKAVKEAVNFSCAYNIPKKDWSNHRVYWQYGNKVVQAYANGNRVEELIDPVYVNRTTPIDMSNNLSVVILSLQVSDEGTYECIVQQLVGGQYRRVHKLDVKLSMRADFSEPIINAYQEKPPSSIWTITCSSSKGYPHPVLTWINDGKELTPLNTTTVQDPTTKLFNVTSELLVNQTKNRSFICLIKSGDFQVSRNYTLTEPPDSQTSILINVVVPFMIFLILIPICYFCKKSKVSLCSYFQRSTTTGTEEEGNKLEPHGESAATSGKSASV